MASFSPGVGEVQVSLTDREQAQVEKLFGDPTVIPQSFKNWMSSYVQADTTTTLSQIEGWATFQSEQAALDASQDSQINGLSGSISNVASDLASAESNITALQNSDATQNSSISNLNSEVSALQSSDTSQDVRLAAIEAKTIPLILASDFSALTVSSTNTLTDLASLTVQANTMPATCAVEFWAAGTWTTSSTTSPNWQLLVATTIIGSTNRFSVSAGTYPWEIRGRWVNLGSVASQYGSASLVIGGATVTGASNVFLGAASTSYSTSSARALTAKVSNAPGASTTITAATLTLLAAS